MNLRGVLVLQLEKTRPIYHEYYLDFARPESKDYFNNCERTFMSLLYGYYNIKYLDNLLDKTIEEIYNFIKNLKK